MHSFFSGPGPLTLALCSVTAVKFVFDWISVVSERVCGLICFFASCVGARSNTYQKSTTVEQAACLSTVVYSSVSINCLTRQTERK